ncbi:hypothetical protein, partial [Streptomyces sp. NPDC058861]|uniref:hypothetical protein n=1 Tax=Streptomyces sp. NPDC058861 TaxID=3346653 RepID=UPI0036B7086B
RQLANKTLHTELGREQSFRERFRRRPGRRSVRTRLPDQFSAAAKPTPRLPGTPAQVTFV